MKKKAFKIITIIYWLMVLVNTDSYYWVYLLLGGLAFWGIVRKLDNKSAKSTIVFGCLFSLMVILANYETVLSFYEGTGKAFYILYTGVSAVFMILGGVYVYTSVFELGHQIVDKGLVVISEGNEKKVSLARFFWLSFAGISVFYLLILFLFNYPGIVSPDAIHQLRMIRDNAYSDHHPLAHTLMIKLFFGFGAEIFGSANAGVAAYSVFQILCVAAGFAYLFMTIYEIGGNYKKIAVITEVVYAILPYNIEFSVSMRKDTLFSLCILLFIVALYRLSRSEKTLCDSIIFSVSSFGICLLRNNGMMIFLACAVIFAIMFKNKKKAELMIMSIIAVFSLAITPMMKNELNAVSPDYLEKVGVPMQQVVRVIVDGYELTDNQNKIAEKLFGGGYRDGLRQVYLPYFADPTKEYIRENGDVKALQDNLNEYFGLYIELGVEHPLEYIKAWIDETRGYWNGGYNYWRWEQGVVDNDFGIYRKYPSEIIHRLMCEYLWLWQRIPFIIPFLCIGLQTWLIMLVMNEGIVRGDKVIVAMTLPLAINILTLMLATPVFAEFRYAYSSFLCVPFLFLTCVRRE